MARIKNSHRLAPTYNYRKPRHSRHKTTLTTQNSRMARTTNRLYRPKPVALRKIRPYQKKSMIHKLPFHVKRVTIKDIQLARRIRGEGLHSLN